ncbi:hypothetical protein [Acinetobacter towneri]|uniref:capsular polysaccharide export protein, LipB/KpsS family n=1 Tax=Acinetobacter towneri TaxID=202956 RepID=UPI0003747E27
MMSILKIYLLTIADYFIYIIKTLMKINLFSNFFIFSGLLKNKYLGFKSSYIFYKNDEKLSKKFILYYYKIINKKNILNFKFILRILSPQLASDCDVSRIVFDIKSRFYHLTPDSNKELIKILEISILFCDFDYANNLLSRYSYLVSDSHLSLLRNKINNQFSLKKDILTDLELAFNNTFINTDDAVNFYWPQTVNNFHIDANDDNYFGYYFINFYKNFYKSMLESNISFISKFEFNWRNFNKTYNKGFHISYHTKFNNGNHLNIKESALAGYFTVDNSGYSGWHSINKEFENFSILEKQFNIFLVNNIFEKLKKEFIENKISKYEQTSNFLKIKGKYIFLPLQIENDSVAQLANIRTYDLLNYALILIEKHDINLVVKRHPKCQSRRIELLLEKSKKNPKVEITNASIHTILPNCQCVLTVNSGVGMEALLYSKTVITTGYSDYSIASIQVKNFSELSEIFERKPNMDENYIKKFIYYYYENHLFRYDDHVKMKKIINKVLRGYTHE